jgi:serine/threonine protein kinase
MSDPVSSVDSLIDIDLSHYRIIEEIGSGGMGVVYRARDAHLDREVAIKVLRPGTISDETARKHLRKEAQVLSKLNHPNIATVYDFDIQGAVDFLVMDYIPGITLSAKLVAGPLPEKEVLRLGVQLSDGLAAAHEHGVVHRDLKPGNLRLTRDGRLKILDFGLAKLRPACGESAATVNSFESNSISGTLPYMAPEQLAGEELDIRTDIHGAGFVLYEMATGQRPFAEVQSGQLIGALLRKAPIPPSRLNPYVSAGLERIIEKCGERDPENRYQSAKVLAVDLQRLQRDTYMGPSNSEADHRQFPKLLLPGWRLFAVVGACILVLVGVAAQLRREHGQAVSPRENTASIAVLPFVDMSLQHDQEYFSDGLAEELLNHLTKIPNLKIAARASAFRFNGKNEDVRVIGKKLNVANVLEGSIRRDGNRIRVNAQLIRADDGFNLWSDSYDRDLKDVFAVQDDIAAAVTSALQLKLHTSTRSTTVPSPKTTIPETYEAFLHARYFSHLFDKESAAKGLEYANQAIQSDQNYAPAYALRATILLSAGGMLWIAPTEATESARRDTEKVIALDPYLADGYRVLSTIRAEIESNCPEAERSLQKARELAPGDPDNLGRGAMLAMCQ